MKSGAVNISKLRLVLRRVRKESRRVVVCGNEHYGEGRFYRWSLPFHSSAKALGNAVLLIGKTDQVAGARRWRARPATNAARGSRMEIKKKPSGSLEEFIVR